jgi:DNA replication protein DnaC
VDEWEAMKEQNVGLLFFGAKGTGKSFYAACIANAIAEKQILTAFTSTANLMNILSTWDKTETMDAICRVPLLVLDDLGAERDTTYSAELMYNVFDSRCKARKPTIVTTNFDLKDMAEEKDLWRSRIYDRVTEMCPFLIRMEGKSRRKANADKRRQDAIEILRNAAKKKG